MKPGKLFLFFQLRCGRGDEEKEVVLIQYMEVIVHADKVEENSDCICLVWSTSDKLDPSVRWKVLEGPTANVGEWDEVERFSSITKVFIL